MSQFTTNSPKEEVLAYLKPVSDKIRAAMNAALPETLQLHHSHGLPLETGKHYDRQYFAYTMRILAKRNLAESGVEAEIEDESLDFKIESASLGGLVLKKPNFVIRILKRDANLELPRAASESRAQFYDQQIPLPFPEAERNAEGDQERDLGIVYLWEENSDFTQLSWRVALPMNRRGDCFWNVSLDEEAANFDVLPAGSDNMPPSRPPIAAVAAHADSDLNYTARTSADEEKTETRSTGISNGA